MKRSKRMPSSATATGEIATAGAKPRRLVISRTGVVGSSGVGASPEIGAALGVQTCAGPDGDEAVDIEHVAGVCRGCWQAPGVEVEPLFDAEGGAFVAMREAGVSGEELAAQLLTGALPAGFRFQEA